MSEINLSPEILSKFKPRPPPKRVYHGTRCPEDLIRERGLAYDINFLIEKTKEFCEMLGVDFELWSNAENPYPDGKNIMNRMSGKRGRIWVTDKFDTAKSYAARNPEILHDVIRSIMHFKHPRRRSNKWYNEIDQTIRTLLSELGTQKVVIIDNTFIGARGVNYPIRGVGSIHPNAILQIVEISED